MNRAISESRDGGGQFGYPVGLIGRLVGHMMAVEHRALHRAVVDRLHLSPDDRVLEIGFGPGTAVKLAARLAAHVSGVDVSREMVRQALLRNRVAARAGKVDLREGSALHLTYPDGSFTVVFEVNSLHHWEDPEAGLREIYRVLHPGGRLLLTLRADHETSAAEEAERILAMLGRIGFSESAVEEHRIAHGGAFVTATRAS